MGVNLELVCYTSLTHAPPLAPVGPYYVRRVVEGGLLEGGRGGEDDAEECMRVRKGGQLWQRGARELHASVSSSLVSLTQRKGPLAGNKTTVH